jgi:formate dehydrogenase gamma subunit
MNDGVTDRINSKSHQYLRALLPVLGLLTALVLFTSRTTLSEDPPPTNESCLDCHEDSEHEAGGLYATLLDSSSHSGFDCVQCHVTITEIPHEDDLPRADCGQCHEDVAADYTSHGRATYPDDPDIPSCSDCHGRHKILSSSDSASLTNHAVLTSTCGQCHQNIDLVQKHDIKFGAAVDVFQSSVHGQALTNGSDKAPICTDCHGAEGNSHRILMPGDPASSINHFAIPKTCGKCHTEEAEAYNRGIHGELVQKGESGSPVCTNCHGEHGIISPKDPRSPVHPIRVAEATCTPCHESAALNEKYGIPTGRLTTWVDSYHGLKSEKGDVAVANCASCHGTHMILPHTDTLSSIHANNLQKTCGECHPGITATLASTTVHGTPGLSSTPIAGIVQKIYVVLIVLVVGMMVFHGVIDFRHQMKAIRGVPQTTRMTTHEVLQHWGLMITFIVLVITGFALRYSDAWWSVLLFGREGGHPLRGTIHRTAAVLFILTSLWHLFYLLTPRGRKFVKDIWLSWGDLTDFINMIRYNLGASIERPQFGKFGYVEKMEYWALVWGTIVMVVTGILLWFDNTFIRFLPKTFLDVMLVIHFYEAILASLAILVWHLYSTVFNPQVYPMNPAWLAGKMPVAMYHHEHGKDSNLNHEENQTGSESDDEDKIEPSDIQIDLAESSQQPRDSQS